MECVLRRHPTCLRKERRACREYDKPLLQTIGNEKLQDDYCATLKSFYGALKSRDDCIKFAMLTGVTKFGKVSVFSDLNNLKEISLDNRNYNLCGIDEKELHSVFVPYLQRLADAQDISLEEAYSELKSNYDGYHFTEETLGIYNPFSLLNALKDKNYAQPFMSSGKKIAFVGASFSGETRNIDDRKIEWL